MSSITTYDEMVMHNLKPTGFIIDEKYEYPTQFSKRNTLATYITLLTRHNNKMLLFRGERYDFFDKRIRDARKILLHKHTIVHAHYTKYGQIDKRYKIYTTFDIPIVEDVWDKKQKQFVPTVVDTLRNVPKILVDMLFGDNKVIIGVW